MQHPLKQNTILVTLASIKLPFHNTSGLMVFFIFVCWFSPIVNISPGAIAVLFSVKFEQDVIQQQIDSGTKIENIFSLSACLSCHCCWSHLLHWLCTDLCEATITHTCEAECFQFQNIFCWSYKTTNIQELQSWFVTSNLDLDSLL